jgi:hypothetical protein
MNSAGIDVRRYAWCRGHALWIVGMVAQGLLEDVRGAQRAGQEGLLRHSARKLGEACAVALALSVRYCRPVPVPPVRATWALRQLGDHELRVLCWELYRGVEEEPAEQVLERCEDLLAQTRGIVGEVPDVLTPQGYFPAMARARDWLKLMDAVGEESFLPTSWTTPL